MKKILLLLLILALVSQAHATNTNNYDANIILDNSAYEEITIFRKYSGESEIKLIFPPDVKNLVTEINGVKTECSQKTILSATEVICPVNLKSNYYIKAKFNTNYVVVDLGEKKLFKQKIHSDLFFEKISIRVNLPENGMIVEPTLNHVTPEPTNIYSDGRRIILLFEATDLKEDFEVSVIYEEKLNNEVPKILFAIILILVFSFMLFKKKAPSGEILLDDEKQILNIVKELKKPVRQKDIEKKVDFSKAKLSRVIRSLEERGVLKRIPRGNTNIIELVKK